MRDTPSFRDISLWLRPWRSSCLIRCRTHTGVVISFPPENHRLVVKHSGIYQGTGWCRCSRPTGTITAGNVQIECSRCAETSADAEHLYLITYKFFHKRSFTGITMAEFIGMLDDYMVWYRDKRIKTESGHGHHGPSTRARSCVMIGGDGINDESNKTAPPPSA